jgi:ABC-type uncharacterized transport system permease subunit
MILLHVAAAILYALSAWALWPQGAAQPAPSRAGAAVLARPTGASATLFLGAALVVHAWLAWGDVVTPDGLDLSLANAVSVVGGLVAAVALLSGLLHTLPAIGTIVLPVGVLSVLLPVVFAHPHDYPFADKPLAAAHVAVALVSYALFLVAAVQAMILMGVEKRLHRRIPDAGRDSAPPLLTLERFLFRLVTAGFVLLTLTLASGMLFSEEVFGRPMPFTHKSVFSMLGWLTFGALLWGRWRYGWRGRKALRWTLAGFVTLLLAYVGSRFVLEVILRRDLV